MDSNETECANRLERCATDTRGPLGLGHSVVFSPGGQMVVSGSWETVRLWDAVTGAALQTLKGYSGDVSSVAFSLDGKLVHTLFVLNDWIAEVETNILWLPPDYRTTCVAVSNRTVVLGHSSSKIPFLEFKEGQSLYRNSMLQTIEYL